MRVSITERLLRQTGHDVAWWSERIATQGGLANEASRCHPSMILTTRPSASSAGVRRVYLSHSSLSANSSSAITRQIGRRGSVI